MLCSSRLSFASSTIGMLSGHPLVTLHRRNTGLSWPQGIRLPPIKDNTIVLTLYLLLFVRFCISHSQRLMSSCHNSCTRRRVPLVFTSKWYAKTSTSSYKHSVATDPKSSQGRPLTSSSMTSSKSSSGSGNSTCNHQGIDLNMNLGKRGVALKPADWRRRPPLFVHVDLYVSTKHHHYHPSILSRMIPHLHHIVKIYPARMACVCASYFIMKVFFASPITITTLLRS